MIQDKGEISFKKLGGKSKHKQFAALKHTVRLKHSHQTHSLTQQYILMLTSNKVALRKSGVQHNKTQRSFRIMKGF